ncbi:response regulator [Natrinema halophilum]|uniref:Response regulator n=1 Tax=Natrinema halophilum TaxID=1699371 RepID=A0A7D5H2E8_9EURY|nr:response regulator [Natrinema halophilum]QLG49031.1 response regulator [Natrinema halophilum]
MKQIDILVAEDNRGDIHLVEQAFAERDLPGEIHSVQTGEEAIDFLSQRGPFAEAPRPDLIVLDLNLPVTSGPEVLTKIRSDPEFPPIPVIVLTGSRSDGDVTRMYSAGANAYLRKPADPNDFMDRMERLVYFWAEEATLPPVEENSGEERSTDQ